MNKLIRNIIAWLFTCLPLYGIKVYPHPHQGEPFWYQGSGNYDVVTPFLWRLHSMLLRISIMSEWTYKVERYK